MLPLPHNIFPKRVKWLRISEQKLTALEVGTCSVVELCIHLKQALFMIFSVSMLVIFFPSYLLLFL